MRQIANLSLMISFLSCNCVWAAESHCKEGEMTYFSCQLKNSKVVSICGNLNESATADSDKGEWVQYRFGRIRQTELLYPAVTAVSVSKFEGNYFAPHGEDHSVLDLRFINANVLYSVEVVSGNGGASGSVSVQLPGKRPISQFCIKPVEPQYLNTFGQLMNSLYERNGETDFLYKFYNPGKK
jgi:hypothetical protein